jgi:DNA-binding transcriptional regulator YbjK
MLCDPKVRSVGKLLCPHLPSALPSAPLLIGLYLKSAIERGNKEIAMMLFEHFPTSVETADMITMCAAYGFHELLSAALNRFNKQNIGERMRKCVSKVVCKQLNLNKYYIRCLFRSKSTDKKKEWTRVIRQSLYRALRKGHHKIVLEFMRHSRESKIGKAVTRVISTDRRLFFELACMHVDVLRFVLSKYGGMISRSCLLGIASETGNLNVVQELIDIYENKPGTEPFTMSLLLCREARLSGSEEETDTQRLVGRINSSFEEFQAVLNRELPRHISYPSRRPSSIY